MKILFYTSTLPAAVNQFNMNGLIGSRPEHEYMFVRVQKEERKAPLIAKIKHLLLQLARGKDHWHHDQLALEKATLKRIPPLTKAYPEKRVAQVNDKASEEAIRAFNPDIIIQAGAGILKPTIFNLAKLGTLNVHHGFAPEVRGMKSTVWCMLYGLNDLHGVTCHFVDATLDTGNVLYQHREPYSAGRSWIDVKSTLFSKGLEMLIKSVDRLGDSRPLEWDKKEISSFYFSMPNGDDYKALRKAGFRAIKNKSGLKTKVKTKTVLRSVNSA